MSFETGGDIQDPFQEDENDGEEDAESASRAEGEKPSNPLEDEPETIEQQMDNRDANSEDVGSQSENDHTTMTKSQPTTEPVMETPYIKDVDVTQSVSPTRLARALMEPTYHEENPPVPYSVWRDGTSTGRSRTTIELNSDVDELVKQALREFNTRYDAEIHKADVRELALVYGLVHLDEVFAMAEEWGIQYNS